MDTVDRDLLTAERSAQQEFSFERAVPPQGSGSNDKETEEDSDYRSVPDSRLRARASSDPERPSSLDLRRITTYRLQQRTTVGSNRGTDPPEQCLPLGAGKPLPPQLPDAEEYVVQFTGHDDPLHPHNWRTGKKYVDVFKDELRLH